MKSVSKFFASWFPSYEGIPENAKLAKLEKKLKPERPKHGEYVYLLSKDDSWRDNTVKVDYKNGTIDRIYISEHFLNIETAKKLQQYLNSLLGEDDSPPAFLLQEEIEQLKKALPLEDLQKELEELRAMVKDKVSYLSDKLIEMNKINERYLLEKEVEMYRKVLGSPKITITE